jgi:7-keto-8-aminopelargonate synthetase-like enzyme
VVLTDGLFAHDGSVAPVARYLECLPKRAVLVIDDAHGAGVLGAMGRGTVEHEKVRRDQVIQLVTLSKAFGLYGGVILCDRRTRERIVERSALFAGNTPLPLPMAAAAFESLSLLQAGSPLRRQLAINTQRIKAALGSGQGRPSSCPGPVVSYAPAHPSDARRLRRRLLAASVFPSHIRYPGGPEGGYFRFAISSAHTADQLDRLAAALSGHAAFMAQGPP